MEDDQAAPMGESRHAGCPTESLTAPGAAAVEARLLRRLTAVRPLIVEGAGAASEHQDRAGAVLADLVEAVRRHGGYRHLWALLTAVWAVYPTTDELLEARRVVELSSLAESVLWILGKALHLDPAAVANHDLEVVADAVLVDVGQTAASDLHTGIQQVVRRTLPLWNAEHAVVAVGWNEGRRTWCRLAGRAARRVLGWEGQSAPQEDDGPGTDPVVLLPWDTVAVLLEVPDGESCEPLAAVASLSGNRVVALGYDCIPVVNADMMHPAIVDRFSRYLWVLKHSKRVAAISRSSAEEFRGFMSAAAFQGLPGAEVVECVLECDPPGASIARSWPTGSDGGEPVVLCVGSLEPRKNHLGLLQACELLWRQGRRFRLLVLAGAAAGRPEVQRIRELQAAGRPVELRVEVSDEELEEGYRRARFSVFPSLHEGYGLPVRESLAYGTPVVTTNYGSTVEAAEGGGALLVDPRDDDALAEAIGRLLDDDALLDDLRRQASARPRHTWEEFATRLWAVLVAPEMASGPS